MEYGSWVFLSLILTDMVLEPDKPETRIRCGTCRRCMDACPTKAIINERVVDARKCISYQTIEKRGRELNLDPAPWVFGCDVCQEVCPHNIRAKVTIHPAFRAEVGAGKFLKNDDIMHMNQKDFVSRFSGTSIMRATVHGLQNTIRTSTTTPPFGPPLL